MNQPSPNSMPDPTGLTIHGLLALPDDHRRLLTWMYRQGHCSLQSVMAFLGASEEDTEILLQDLERQGFIQTVAQNQESLYTVKLASMRRIRHQQGHSTFPSDLLDGL